MLSLVHLIYMAGDKCMRQNACFLNHFYAGQIVKLLYLYLHNKVKDTFVTLVSCHHCCHTCDLCVQ